MLALTRAQSVLAKPMADGRLAPPNLIGDSRDGQPRVHQGSEHVALETTTPGVLVTVSRGETMLCHPVPHRRRMPPDARADRLQGQPGRQPLLEHLTIHSPGMTNTRSPAGANCHTGATRR